MTREEKNYFNTLLNEEPNFKDAAECRAYEEKLQNDWLAFQRAQYEVIGEMIRQMDAKIERFQKERDKEQKDEKEKLQVYDG